jgi:hypothetical protein
MSRNNGAPGKGGSDAIGRDGAAVIGCLHVCHFQGFAEKEVKSNSIQSITSPPRLLPPMTAVGIVVGVVVWIRIIIWIWIIIWIVRVCVIIWFSAGLPTALGTHYSILRKSDQANRISA